MPSRGERFVNSLNDGRSILLEGERIEDLYLSCHPAFKGTLETITRLFNLLDDPNEKDNVGFNLLDKESYAHSSFLVSYTLALGSRHELYERFYAGNPVRAYAKQYSEADQGSFTDPIWQLLRETSK